MSHNKNSPVQILVKAKELWAVSEAIHLSYKTSQSEHKPACTVGRIEDFIVEYGEVQSETQTNGVCRLKVCHCNITSSFISNQTVFCSLLPVVSCGKLGKIPVVVALPVKSDTQTKHMSFIRNSSYPLSSEVISHR